MGEVGGGVVSASAPGVKPPASKYTRPAERVFSSVSLAISIKIIAYAGRCKTAFNFETPVEEQKKYITDDFEFSDSMCGPVMNKDAWFAMGDMYRASLPDGGFVFDEIHQEGEDVIATGHFTGTFKHDLDLTTMNLGGIKATGKQIKFPSGTSRISFKGEKIYKNKDLTTGPNGGFAAFLAALKNGNK
jgi:predicted ester cyclase